MAAKKDTAAAPAAGNSDKKKAIETAMQQIEKLYGKGSLMRLSLIHIWRRRRWPFSAIPQTTTL